MVWFNLSISNSNNWYRNGWFLFCFWSYWFYSCISGQHITETSIITQRVILLIHFDGLEYVNCWFFIWLLTFIITWLLLIHVKCSFQVSWKCWYLACFIMHLFLYSRKCCSFSVFVLCSWHTRACLLVRYLSSDMSLQQKSLWHLPSMCLPVLYDSPGNKHWKQCPFLLSCWKLFLV